MIAGCASSPNYTALEGMPADAPVQNVELKGNDCEWIPETIRVDKGSHVILDVHSVDWDYNFRMKGYNLQFQIPKGETVTAEFYAPEEGEFEFGCYIEEGLYYKWGDMIGKVIVE
jgi:heme/copper-type cytochrome/quinol oxidase subunit 2